MTGHMLFSSTKGVFELLDQSDPGGRQPFEMPPGILKIAQRVAD